MASISIPDQQRRIDDPAEIVAFLAPLGIHYESWDVAGRISSPDASSEEILAAYAPEIERLKAAGGYVTADVINVSPTRPTSTPCWPGSARNTRTAKTRCDSSSRASACFISILTAARCSASSWSRRPDQRAARHASIGSICATIARSAPFACSKTRPAGRRIMSAAICIAGISRSAGARITLRRAPRRKR